MKSTRLRLVAMALPFLLLVLALPTVAFAATGVYNYPVGTMHGSPSSVGVAFTGSPAFKTTTGQIKIDNVVYKTTVSLTASGHWVLSETGPDANGAYKVKWTWVADPKLPNQASLSCYPSGAALADGTHNVTASIKDNANATWTYSWAYVVAVPPTFGAPLPTDGSTVNIPTPVISVPVSDNNAVTSASATVNGSPATATLGSGKVTVTGFTLATDGPVTVAVTAGDAQGNTSAKSWTFTVSYYANLTCHNPNCHGTYYDTDVSMGPDCISCHPNVPHAAAHTTVEPAVSCQDAGCHPGTNLVPIHAALACADCHSSPDSIVTGAIAAGDKRCATCHPGESHNAPHSTALPAVSCQDADCHPGTNLLHIHSPLPCATCHRSSDPAVTGAITAGDTRCATCHPSATADHVTFHTTALPAVSCQDAGCHPGPNLLPIHAALACADCHSSADPAVLAAIDANDKRCATCHPSATADHVTFHTTALPAVSCQDAGCHPGTNLLPIHAALACADCHSSSDSNVTGAIAANDKRCATCHPSATADHVTFHTTALPAVSCQDAGCHPGTNLLPIHAALACADCHSSSDSNVTGAIAANDKRCATCHPSATADHVTFHTTALPAVSCQDAGCHPGTNLLPIHAALACADCHSSSDSIVTGAIAAGDKRCATCHPSATADHVTFHTTALPAVSCQDAGCHPGTNLLPIHAALACADCHSSPDSIVTGAIAAGDKRCATCHPSATADHVTFHTTALPAVSCQDAGCHPGTNLLPIHAALACADCHSSSDSNVTGAIAANDKRCATCHPSATADHVTFHTTALPAVSCQDAGCHPGTNLLPIHAALACADCHSSSDSNVTGAITAGDKRCATCHDPDNPHGDMTAIHTSSGGTDFVAVGLPADGDHGGSEAAYLDCSSCHSSNLLTLHASDCARCHSAAASDEVKAAVAGSDTTCVACHPSHHVDSGLNSDHVVIGSQGCEVSEGACHNVNPYGGDSSDLECVDCHSAP